MPVREPLPAPTEWGTFRPKAIGSVLVSLSRNSIAGRGALRKAVYAAFKRAHSGPVDCKVWGTPVRLYPFGNPTDRKALLRPDQLDRRELKFLRAQMAKPGAVFLDLGANSGLYSLCAALHAGPGARIVAVEPDGNVLSRLAFNVGLARSAARIGSTVTVSMINTAVGDRDGEARLSTDTQEGARSLLSGSGQVVRLRRLAGLLDEERVLSIELMKIDVEGYEDKVVLPYLEAVEPSRWPRSIIIEHVHRDAWSRDCLADCGRLGYRTAFATRSNSVLVMER
jgi:FkbM family methyltransferase